MAEDSGFRPHRYSVDLRASDRPTGSYPKTGVMSGLATTLPEHLSTRVQKQPSQINPKGAVHEA
jgi:hypothetical protein